MIRILSEWKIRTPLYVQVLLLLATVLFVSFLFPNQGKFRYQYSVGKVWKYEDLYAPYDFSIRKTNFEIDESISRVQRDFIPYFYRDTSVLERSLAFIQSQLTSLALNSVDSLEQSIELKIDKIQELSESNLRKIYDKGVITYSLEYLKKDSLPVINLQDKGIIALRRSNSFYSLQEARSEMVDILNPYNEDDDIIQMRNVFEQSIDANILYDEALSKRFLEQEMGNISYAIGKVSKGEIIIRKGNIINKEVNQILVSLEERFMSDIDGKNSYWQIYIGHLLFSLLIISLFYFYLRFKYPSILSSINKLLFFLVWFWLFAYLVFSVESNESLSVYMLPFCIVPIVIKNFFNETLAFITLILLVLLTSFISSPGLDFAFIMILGGLVAILIETETRYWARYFYSISLVVISLFLGYLCISLIKEGSISSVNWGNYNWLIVNGILTLLSYPLIPLLERIFGFTSSITLAELSDLNKPLLKKLSIKAPGTFQHSIQVANLAEAAANKIGANSLLVKVGALYHDVGKMNHPGFFIENSLDQTQMHDKLSCEASAQIIIGHVNEGVQIARTYGLPPIIIDFIKTHHGTTKVEYFYQKHLKECEEGEETPHVFTYPGPRPRSKEQSILMLADSIEAASKSMKFESEQAVDDFVDRIIYRKLKAYQLEHSELSFEELETCRRVFKKMLKSIYHSRIVYPASSVKEK